MFVHNVSQLTLWAKWLKFRSRRLKHNFNFLQPTMTARQLSLQNATQTSGKDSLFL